MKKTPSKAKTYFRARIFPACSPQAFSSINAIAWPGSESRVGFNFILKFTMHYSAIFYESIFSDSQVILVAAKKCFLRGVTSTQLCSLKDTYNEHMTSIRFWFF